MMMIWKNNQKFIKLTKNSEYHIKTKHIDICHHYIRKVEFKISFILNMFSSSTWWLTILSSHFSLSSFYTSLILSISLFTKNHDWTAQHQISMLWWSLYYQFWYVEHWWIQLYRDHIRSLSFVYLTVAEMIWEDVSECSSYLRNFIVFWVLFLISLIGSSGCT
jgi:hypothetical protein